MERNQIMTKQKVKLQNKLAVEVNDMVWTAFFILKKLLDIRKCIEGLSGHE